MRRAASPYIGGIAVLTMVAHVSVAQAQPAPLPNPYPPVPAAPAPTVAAEPEPVATALIERAEALLAQEQYADAKQLAVESLQLNPSLALSARADRVLQTADLWLGIGEPPAPAVEPTPPAPTPEPKVVPLVVAHAPEHQSNEAVATVHGGIAGATLAASVGVMADDATVAILGGLAGAVGGGYLGNRWLGSWQRGETRTMGSTSMWSGVTGGLLVDVMTYNSGARDSEIAVGVALGTIFGGLAGYGLAQSQHFTAGQVALLDSAALLGGGAGISLGFVMQPVNSQAYSANAALGVTGGFVVAALLAKRISPSEQRMAKITGLAAVGAVVPWLGYSLTDGSTSAQQWAGGLSIVGTIVGAYAGYHFTQASTVSRERLDLLAVSPALLQRTSAGQWRLGVVAPRTLGHALTTDQATVLDVAAGRF